MEENKKEKSRRKWCPRKLYRFLGILAFVLLFLQVVFYFGANYFLRNYVQEKVRIASEDKYEIDFDSFHILFLQRGVSFKGLSINPVDEKIELLENIAYYKLEFPTVSLKGFNYLFRKRELVIGNIELESPVVDFRLKISDLIEDKPQDSPLEVLQNEIKKSFLESGLQEIRIKNLKINNADLLIRNFIAQRSIKAENSSLLVKNIQLLQDREPATPFNAEGFLFEIENFELLLADSVHNIRAQQLKVSSLDQFIQAKNLFIEPDFSRPSESYFKASLEDLMLSDADINKVFYTSEVEIGELRLQRPKFDLYVESRKTREQVESEVKPFEFYDLIDGILVSIQIRKLDIENGEFAQRSITDREKFRIMAKRIGFNMEDFYVGPNEGNKRDQFFYADQARVELSDVDLALADGVHWIKGDYVLLSSQEDKIKIEGFHLFPLEEQDSIKGQTRLEILVPQVNITKANLKKIYNAGIVDVQDITVEGPEILLKDVKGKQLDGKGFDFSDFYSEYLEGIYVRRFEIKEGSLIVDNKLRIRQDSLSFGKVNLVLENFAIDKETENADTRSFFWAENLQLELRDYALKLADNLHVFKADRVYLNTKTSELEIDGFSLKPFDPGQIQPTLDRYGRTTSLDIFVPRFRARGVGIRDAYFDEVLKVDRITVPAPRIGITRYRSTTAEEDEEKADQKEILDLLTNYFKEVKIGNLSLQNGTLNYEGFGRDRIQTFSEENVSIAVRNFHIHEKTDPENVRFLFSEEIDLRLNNYVFNIADGKYNLIAERINFNTAREEITVSNVRLNPNLNIQDKTRVAVNIPELSFRGVDLEAFLFDNTLSLEKVRLLDSKVNLLINNDYQETSVRTSQRRLRKGPELPKTIDVVSIDTIQAEKAHFNLAFREKGNQRELIDTRIDLSIYGFLMDSAKISNADIAGFFNAMSLGIDEFWLTLNDSIHRITFSKVELDTRYEGILLNNFRIIPEQLSGNPGKPIFSGHIPRALIKTKSLSEIQKSKDVWITELRLFRPDLEIFVDQVKSSGRKEKFNEEKKEILESIQVDDFELVEGKISILQKDGSKAPQELKDLTLGIQDLVFNLTDFQGISRQELLKKDFKLDFPNFQLLLKDSLNRVSAGRVAVNNQEIVLTNVLFEPRFGKYRYARKVGHQTDVARFEIPEIRIKKADLNKLLEEEILEADLVVLESVSGEFFRDKRFERPNYVFKPMPQELMKNIGILARIDTLLLKDAKIVYLEFPEKGMVPGEIYFSELDALLVPFHLGDGDASYYVRESQLLANAKINGEAPISLQGRLYFEAPYRMNINAQLGEFDLDLINSILKYNAFVRVRSGKINSADWSFTANEREAFGRMKMLYSGLNLELLERRTLEKGKGRDRILTFVLNTFAVRSNNPRKFIGGTIYSNIYHPRDTDRFIFNYWWRTTVSGLKGSVGLGQPKIPKRKEEE
ncbi:hypothetical protein [Cecembia rubra]|uniref:hypothetical protein n=1 Tax=Cecembia rubra TaxID=1485585 RepID=UPI0027152F2B|nr:hypothetical protein [Cecembia rubra]